MEKPWQITEGRLVVGDKIPPPPNGFSGQFFLDLQEQGYTVHFKAIRIVTGSRDQAQAIADILNAHKGEWQ